MATRIKPKSAATNLIEYTVSELAFALKRTVEDAYGLVRLRGEISPSTRTILASQCPRTPAKFARKITRGPGPGASRTPPARGTSRCFSSAVGIRSRTSA